ncbi:hypothetical protein TWF506_007595 [Arthrobotrys conoides]|uniref:Histone H4 n=1 Tax=Arthrobotrys conoides TaxID=74498 RepID=A0AAN8NQ28_9PEZI
MPPGRDLNGRNAPTRGPSKSSRSGGMPTPRPVGSAAVAAARGADSTPTRPAQAATPFAMQTHRLYQSTQGETSRSGAQGGGSVSRPTPREDPAHHSGRGRGKGGKGLGTKGPLRHRKVLRDNIQGITRPAIRRIARRGGVKRISASIYEEIRGVIKNYLETILKSCVMYTEHARRKTVTTTDVIHALKIRGRTLYGFDDPSVIKNAKSKRKLANFVARR